MLTWREGPEPQEELLRELEWKLLEWLELEWELLE